MADISTITVGGVTYDLKDATAREESSRKVYTISITTFSSFPKIVSDENITSDMVVTSCVFGTPKSVTSDVAWTTTNGTLRLTGSINGSTSAQVTLVKSEFGH